jgi:DNA repair ATPase RecN
MTLKSIKLKNFQAHRDLQVDFVPGVNTIVGPTNVGKSSVFRAVRWLVEHKPISGLQTFDTEDTRVGIKSDAGSVIRFKSSKGYGYRIGGQDFVACGTNQPSEVQLALGLAEINLQGQHDPPFLLTLTPGQMAKELNRIVDLSVIDKAMATTTSAVAAAKSQATAVEELVKGYETKAAQLAWVSQADEDLASIEAIEAEIHSAKTQVVQIEQALLDLLSNHNQQQRLEPVIQELSELAKLIAAFEGDVAASRRLGFAVGASETNLACLRDVNAAGKALAGLAVDAKTITEATTKIITLSSLISSYAKLGALGDFGPELDSMLADAASIKSANDTIAKIKSTLGSHRLAIDSIASQEKEITKLEKEKPICAACKRPLA